MTIEFVAKQLFGYDSENSKESLGKKFAHISQGLLSFPLNIPGTIYHNCLKVISCKFRISAVFSQFFLNLKLKLLFFQSRNEVMDIMRTTLKERLASPDTYHGDFLEHALEDVNTEKFLTEDFILQIMFGLLFASSESTSMTLTLVFKFLSENPRVLGKLEVSKNN